ncbi:hypothetical protein HYV83_00415 [Candidatus Woesearchaeota archaeon]|nr:hypothetical protein [Candidatus Woesearchaeota archaeon]
MAITYKVQIKLAKTPQKLDLTPFPDMMDVNIYVMFGVSGLDEIFIFLNEHDDELNFLKDLDEFIGRLKKETGILAIDLEDFVALCNYEQFFNDIKKMELKNLPTNDVGKIKSENRHMLTKDILK